MVKNMNTVDRALRIVLAVILGYLIIDGTLIGVWAWVLGILAVIFLLTSIVGYCPSYKFIGVSTLGEKAAPPPES